jgi:hypothetical protein
MSTYKHTTRGCPVSEFHADLRQVMHAHFLTNGLGDPATEALQCCETISTKDKPSRLPAWLLDEPDTTIIMGMVLTPQWLVWARSGDRSGLVLNAANLKNIQTGIFISKKTNDVLLEITGYVEGSKERTRGTLALGSEEAALRFAEALKEQNTKMNPPSKRKFLGVVRD